MASVDFGREWDLNAGAGSSSYVGSTVRAHHPVFFFFLYVEAYPIYRQIGLSQIVPSFPYR